MPDRAARQSASGRCLVNETLRTALASIADQLGLPLAEPQREALLAYLSLLQRWNLTYNLTSVRDPSEMLTLHLADCLAVVGPMKAKQGDHGSVRVLDVGSGAGLPGIVLAILQPSLSMTCLDKVGKKAAFVRQAVAELGLTNVAVQHGRVEGSGSASFGLIVSRAFASLAEFVALTRHHLAPGGVWLAMKGKPPAEELLALPSDIDVFHVEPLQIPGLNAQRCLVWMRLRQSA